MIGIFGVLAGSAVALALFLSSFFLGVKRKDDPQNLWVGLILLAVGLRVGKSIFYFLLNDMAPFGLALGFLGLSSIGPLTWLMVRQQRTISLRYAWHWIIPVIGSVVCYLVSPSPWETVCYQSATILLLLYLFAAWIRLWRMKKVSVSRNEASQVWSKHVLIMVTGVWATLVYQHLSATMLDYAVGAVGAAGFIYWLFFKSFNKGVFSKEISVSLPDQTLQRVRKALEQEGSFKQAGMNLQQFSSDLDIPSYLVTRSVKALYDRTFPETLNHFRVEAVKQMLLDPNKEHLKIESLAYEVGFASPSAFYAAFKKHTGQTPTTYQKQAGLLSA